MLGGALSLACVGLFGQELGRWLSLPGLVFMRMAAPFVLLGLVYLVASRRSFRGGGVVPHLVRAFFAVTAQYCFFYVLLNTTLVNATLLFTTSGLFVPLIGRVVLGQEIRLKTGIAILISFAGTAIVLDPQGGIGFGIIALGLLSGFLNASSQVTLHRASKSSLTPLQIAMAAYGLSAAMALVVTLATGEATQLSTTVRDNGAQFWLPLLLLSVFSIANQVLRTRAYQKVNKPGSLVPYLYTTLAFSGVLDWWVFGLVPGVHVYLGGAILLGGAALMAARRSTLPHG